MLICCQEHETALRFFQRALQLDPTLPYAYTLAGHEYFANEDFEKVRAALRRAALRCAVAALGLDSHFPRIHAPAVGACSPPVEGARGALDASPYLSRPCPPPTPHTPCSPALLPTGHHVLPQRHSHRSAPLQRMVRGDAGGLRQSCRREGRAAWRERQRSAFCCNSAAAVAAAADVHHRCATCLLRFGMGHIYYRQEKYGMVGGMEGGGGGGNWRIGASVQGQGYMRQEGYMRG